MPDGVPLKPPSHPRYEILEEIARGGMGVVYRVMDRDLNRVLALKWLVTSVRSDEDAPSSDYYARFLEEVQITAQLDHPAIVPIMDLGFDEESDRPFYTMRYVRGRDLDAVMELARDGREGWNLSRLIEVLVKVCQALEHAHGKGVLHRDLKPSNIMVGDLGEVYVMDWGLARMLGEEDRRDLRLQLGEEAGTLETFEVARELGPTTSIDAPLMTMDGAVVGTPAYMPPEQALGRIAEVDQSSDVYALGAILYQMLSGHPPYMPANTNTTAKKVLTELRSRPPERIRQLDVKLAPELVAICEKAMARDQAARYRSGQAMAAELQAYLDGRVVEAHQTGGWIELKKWVARNRALAAVASGGVLVALIGLGALAVVEHAASERVSLANKATRQTLAEMHTAAGLAEEDPAIAAAWFAEAAALAEADGDEASARANRIRVRQWSRQSFPPLRSLQSDLTRNGSARTEELLFHPWLPYLLVKLTDKAEVWDLILAKKPEGPDAVFLSGAWCPLTGNFALVRTDGQVQVWDLAKGTLLETFRADVGQATEVAYSDDGALLGIVGDRAVVYDLSGKRFVGEPQNLPKPATWLGFGPESRQLAVAYLHEARLYEIGDDAIMERHVFPHKQWLPNTYYFTPPTFVDGLFVTLGADQGTNFPECSRARDFPLKLWDPLSGELRSSKELPYPTCKIIPDEQLILTSTAVCDWESGRALYTGVGSKAVSPDGSRVVIGRNFSTLHSPREGEHLEIIGAAFSELHLGYPAIAFSPDGLLLATINLHGGIRLWRLWQEMDRIPIIHPSTTNVVASPDGIHVLLNGSRWDGTEVAVARVVEPQSGRPAGPGFVPKGKLTTGTFSADGDTVVLISADGEGGWAQFVDWREGRERTSPIKLPSAPRYVARSPGGESYAVLCAAGDLVKIYDEWARMERLARLDATVGGTDPKADGLFVFGDAAHLLYLNDDLQLHLVDATTGQLTRPAQNLCVHASYPMLAQHGSLLAYRTGDIEALRLGAMDWRTGEVLVMPEFLRPNRGAFDQSGERLLVGGSNGVARVWNVRAARWMGAQHQQESRIAVTAFVPEAPVVFTQDQQQNAHFWEPESGRLLAPAHDDNTARFYGPINVVAGDRKALVVAPRDTGRHLWSYDLTGFQSPFELALEDERLLARVQANRVIENGAARKPTHAEWHEAWQRFRTQQPHYQDAQIAPPQAARARWHRYQAIAGRHGRRGVEWHARRWWEASGDLEALTVILEASPDSVASRSLCDELLSKDTWWRSDPETLALICHRLGEMEGKPYPSLAQHLLRVLPRKTRYACLREVRNAEAPGLLDWREALASAKLLPKASQSAIQRLLRGRQEVKPRR